MLINPEALPEVLNKGRLSKNAHLSGMSPEKPQDSDNRKPLRRTHALPRLSDQSWPHEPDVRQWGGGRANMLRYKDKSPFRTTSFNTARVPQVN